MKEIIQKIEKNAQKTIDYFVTRFSNGNSFDSAKDLCCFFKLPMLLIKAGQKDLAGKVIHFILNAYFQAGDFKSQPLLKSIKPEYIEYWLYMNGWICRAANQLEVKDIRMTSANDFILNSISQKKGLQLTHNPQLRDGIIDVLTVAHFGLINLEKNNLKQAENSAIFLLDAYKNQPEISSYFYLRFTEDAQPITTISDNQSMFMRIGKENDQLFFMIAYPAAFLAILYKKTRNEAYLDAAKLYLDFAFSCDKIIFSSRFSHKIAWASSLLFEITGEQKYLEAVKKIISYFQTTQDENGLWFANEGETVFLDQSAEIALWFLEIANNLKKAKLQLSESEKYQIPKFSKGLLATAIADAGLFATYKVVNYLTERYNSPFDIFNLRK